MINWDVYAGNTFSQPHRHYLDNVFLAVDMPALSQSSGIAAVFTLTAGRANAGRNHLLLVGFTGTEPGTLLQGGAVLPLNLDALSPIVLQPGFGSIFQGFLGTLDANGEAVARLMLPPAPSIAGLQLSFAYTLDAPWEFASTSVSLSITP